MIRAQNSRTPELRFPCNARLWHKKLTIDALVLTCLVQKSLKFAKDEGKLDNLYARLADFKLKISENAPVVLLEAIQTGLTVEQTAKFVIFFTIAGITIESIKLNPKIRLLNGDVWTPPTIPGPKPAPPKPKPAPLPPAAPKPTPTSTKQMCDPSKPADQDSVSQSVRWAYQGTNLLIAPLRR